MTVKDRIKVWLGICLDEEEETQELKSKQEKKGFSFLGCTFNELLAISLVSSSFLLYSLSYYHIQRVYERVEDDYQLLEEYVVSSSPFALHLINAGDEVAVDMGNGYTLTETVQEVTANTITLVNEAGATKTVDRSDVKGKVVKNPSSLFFHVVIKLIT